VWDVLPAADPTAEGAGEGGAPPQPDAPPAEVAAAAAAPPPPPQQQQQLPLRLSSAPLVSVGRGLAPSRSRVRFHNAPEALEAPPYFPPPEAPPAAAAVVHAATGGGGGGAPSIAPAFPAEGALQYGPRGGVLSLLCGNPLEMCGAAAGAAGALAARAAEGGAGASEALAALTRGIALPPGVLVARPPPPPLPRHAHWFVGAALVTLLPGALLHEYLFQRALALALATAAPGGRGSGARVGAYPAVPLPAGDPAALAAAVAWAQGVTLFSLTAWLVALSLHFLSRGATAWCAPRRLATRAWLAAAAAALALQAGYSVGVASQNGAAPAVPNAAWATWDLWTTIALWQLAAHALLTVAKAQDVARYVQTQRRSKLLFDTRLGQYSPR
jgi:hypothetical protein